MDRFNSPHDYISGVAYLETRLYILFTNFISVYCLDPLFHLKVIKIDEMQLGGDIATCQKSKSLFVIEGNRGIWKVDTAGTSESVFAQNYNVTSWLSSTVYSSSLSVSKAGRVLVIREEKPPSWLEVLEEDATVVTVVKSIQLPSFVIDPLHAVETVQDSFLISFGQNSGLIHGVCEVNDKGQLVKIYSPSASWQFLRNPSHLTINKEGRVVITDQWNNRLVVLDDKLRYVDILLSKGMGGFEHPFWLCFVADNQLMVVHGFKVSNSLRGGNKIDIFNIK